MTINDFQYSTHIDNLNLFKVEKYFQRSEIVKKVNGFTEKVNDTQVVNRILCKKIQFTCSENDDELVEKHRPSLGVIESFLLALTNADKDGRIVSTIFGNHLWIL